MHKSRPLVKRCKLSAGLRLALVAVALTVAWMHSGQAQAQDEHTASVSTYDERGNPPATRWYGWQTLLADAIPFGLGIAGYLTDTPALAIIGFGIIPLGAPIVHWANGNVGGGFLSLGMRVACDALIITGGLISLRKQDNWFGGEHETNVGDYIAIAGAALLLSSMIVDAVFVARVKSKTSVLARTHSPSIRPWLDVAHARAGLSLAIVL